MCHFNLKDYFRHPQAVAIQAGSRIVTQRDLQIRIIKALAWLNQELAKEGDIWALQGLNPLDSWVFMLAASLKGLISVPLNPKFTGSYLDPYRSQVPWHRFVSEPLWNMFPDQVHPEEFEQLIIDSNKAAFIIFTSGSSGKPKGVVHSWESLRASAEGTLKFYDFQIGNSWLLSLGMFHVGGLLIAFRTLLGHGRLCVGDETEGLKSQIRSMAPDFLSLVPTQLRDLLFDPEMHPNLKKCRGILLGGAPMSPQLLEQITNLNLPVSITYGSSEAASQLTATKVGALPSDHRCGGFPLEDRELQIIEDRIAFKGKVCFLGYWQEGRFYPQKQDSWFLTPDRGRWSSEGLLIEGRCDDVFMCGGEGISRSEIQALIDRFIVEGRGAVVRQKDDRLGMIPVLIIEAPEQPDMIGLQKQIEQHLPALKRPRAIYWKKGYPEIGKPQIAKLEQELAEMDPRLIRLETH